MKIPPLTAEAGLGPVLHTYAAAATATTAPGRATVATMGFFDTLGGVFNGVLGKIPCLLGCGIPNAVSIATQCGFDPACWVSKAPAAGVDCLRQCLN